MKSDQMKGKKSGDEAPSDPRFRDFNTDPRFRLPSRAHAKVKIDSRFTRMLHDADFSGQASVDRYGRKLQRDSGRKELERFYRIDDEDGAARKAPAPAKHPESIKNMNEVEPEEPEDEEGADEADEVASEESSSIVERKYDPARDGGFSSSGSDSDSDDSGSDDGEFMDDDDEQELQLPYEAEVPMGEVSSRIAVVNLDWDNIRAVDLLAVASSFVPTGGKIQSVIIYPSEFGLERLERETLEGPPREIFSQRIEKEQVDDAPHDNGKIRRKNTKHRDEDEEDEDEEDERIKRELLQEDTGEEYSSTALRAYQLERLRYFYAVITCSTAMTAKALYDAMDGREYLASANFFDLRFIPKEATFDDQKPRDSCNILTEGYRPAEFVTDALTHSKVKLTWDADDRNRKEVQKRAFSRTEIDENDLKAYIGTDSSGESDLEEGDNTTTVIASVAAKDATNPSAHDRSDKAAALRSALGLGAATSSSSRQANGRATNTAPVGDIQITWTSALSNTAPGTLPPGPPVPAPAASKTPASANSVREETTRDIYVRKERERKARRKDRARGGPGDGDNSENGAAAGQDSIAAATAAAAAAKAASGFDDPFFTDPAAAALAEKRTRRAVEKERRQRRDDAAAAAADPTASRASLELLLASDGPHPATADSASQPRHFDMAEIERAEKRAARPKRRHRRDADNIDPSGPPTAAEADDFQMNVSDPRFGAVFSSHEYALDPTSAKFKPTRGMRALLDEGRRKRARELERADDAGDMAARKSKKVKKVRAKADEADDLDGLVARVKNKIGQA